MPHIKELIIHGFKSFARETKVPFRQTMNVIVGPNGSGKSNVTDAICFVLGRLGSKSMRAKKLANLIFAGTDKYKPAKEASVEMIFDNSDKGFSLNEPTVSIKRILRRNGQGIYKINNEVKTRQEVLELMAQAGIDPNGFNIVLQGEIDAFVKMPPDKRRQIIEEVAGISIYEIRKQRSLKELEKTEQRLKEVNATLRERQAYLRNLEQERKQALKFKKLQQDVKDLRSTILNKIVREKTEKVEEINKKISSEQKKISSINELVDKNNQQISVLNGKIEHITNNIQKSSGIEQEALNSQISDIRAEIAGLDIKKQSLETQTNELGSRKKEVEESIQKIREEVQEMSKSKGKSKNIKPQLEQKKQELEKIEENKRKLYVLKSNIATIKSRIEDKKRQVQRSKNESDFSLNRIEELESKITIKEPLEKHQESISRIKASFDKLNSDIQESESALSENEKKQAALERQIQELDKVKEKVNSLDICPLCKTKMTKEHVSKVTEETKDQQETYTKEIKQSQELVEKAIQTLSISKTTLEKSEQELKIRAQDVLRLEIIQEKKSSLRKLSEDQKQYKKEQQDLEVKYTKLESEMLTIKTSEERSDSLRLEIQELERAQEKDLGMDLTLKQRDIERLKNVIKQATREIEEASTELNEVIEELDDKQEVLEEKSKKDEALKQKFKKLLEEKNSHQEKIRFFERDILHKQNQKHGVEQVINNLKIERAQYLAQKESNEEEAKEFKDGKILRLSIQEARIRLDQTQRSIDHIGSVNLRALEIYEDFKKQYDQIQEKADTLITEKQDILTVIEDIDKKKKKVFVQTLKEINTLFSRNFSQLSSKGAASLEPVDKDDIFESGLEMLIKVGKGKYFDTHLLSGGEQCLVSLALIFAIQEYKPYCFYIFDEIDAALDRRNSERLATLLRKYMKQGQYIIVTHNDSLITEAPVIYGVSMQDKISQILSLEV
jgi:chromosome segregation protein